MYYKFAYGNIMYSGLDYSELPYYLENGHLSSCYVLIRSGLSYINFYKNDYKYIYIYSEIYSCSN
jgi:hypothetical protein